MFEWPEGVEFGNKPRHLAAGRALIPLPQRPPEPREKVKAIYRFVKPLAGMLAQEPKFTGFQMCQDFDVLFRWSHLSLPFFWRCALRTHVRSHVFDLVAASKRSGV